jgi:hypothetical protein
MVVSRTVVKLAEEKPVETTVDALAHQLQFAFCAHKREHPPQKFCHLVLPIVHCTDLVTLLPTALDRSVQGWSWDNAALNQ